MKPYTEKDFLKFNYLSLQLPLTDSLKQLNIKTNKMKIQVRRMKNAAFEHHLQMSLEEMSLQTQYYEVKYGDFDVKIRHC